MTFILGVILWVPLSPARESINAVYGKDGRKEVYESASPVVQTAARATAMLMAKSAVHEHPNGFLLLDAAHYGESLNLCSSEPFFNQMRFGYCSGVLVAPDLLLTAGHCVVNERQCAQTAVVFDVMYDKISKQMPWISTQQMRYCQGIVYRSNRRTGLDFALLRLSAPMTDRRPVSPSKSTAPGHGIFMIGYPLGLPAKYVGGSRIVRDTKLEWVTDLDASAGNSGSPVFSSTTGHLIGILTAGEDGDFRPRPRSSRSARPSKSCLVSKSCSSQTCFGELVLKLEAIRSALSPGVL